MKRVTLIMEDGKEVGPVKIVGKIGEIQTKWDAVLIAKVYADPSILPDSTPSIVQFSAVYTNFSNRMIKSEKPV